MFRGVFRETCDAGSAALTRDLETIFLEHPHYDETTSSLVYERPDGEVAAFFGCLPLRMNFMGSRQLGSIMSTWMVGDRTRDPRAGAMLLQTHLKRRHPFTLADTANSTSLEFANSIKITPLTTHCLQWIKPLNYCGYAISSVGGGKDSRTLRALTRLARESENGFRRLTRERPKDALEGWRFQAIDPAAFAGHFLSLVEDYPVRPDWSAGFVSWLLDQCNSRPGLGPLRLCEVANPKGAIVGCFAYHVTSRGRAVVLQILSRRGAEASVLQALIADATANHCVVVSGSTTQRVLEGLLRIPNVYYRHTCGTGVKTQQPDSLRAFLAGDALVGGLVGDSWTPLTSERYD